MTWRGIKLKLIDDFFLHFSIKISFLTTFDPVDSLVSYPCISNTVRKFSIFKLRRDQNLKMKKYHHLVQEKNSKHIFRNSKNEFNQILRFAFLFEMVKHLENLD